MSVEQPTTSIRGERAMGPGDVDRLGFKEVARRISGALVDHATEDGLVVGIDGQWGSGKSSLLHLIATELGQLAPERQPTIISFQPWLVGNRDALLASLFNQLAEAIGKVELSRGDASAETVRKAKVAAERARKFAASVSKAGQFLEAVSFLAGWLKPIGAILTALSNLSGKREEAQLDLLKDNLKVSLRELKHRFVITVDDVDRLEPTEVVEVLRLVRSVADFPNIIYLLCYDSLILAESVKRGADVPDGAAFLEKIVQLTVMVPRPEPFQLRQWFSDEIGAMVGSLTEEQLRRLRGVIDQEGGIRLQTPRSVVRGLDSFRFFWPALRDERIDVSDLVWLLLIKDGAPRLYRWIESYLGSAASVATGIGTVSETVRAQELRDLAEIVGPNHFSDIGYRHSFAEILPGIEIDYTKDGDDLKLYQRISDHERNASIEGRRLASPDHYRLYLALIGPGHAIKQKQADDFWTAATIGATEAAQSVEELAKEAVSPDLSKADLLFERLGRRLPETVTPEQATNLLIGLGNIMDALDTPESDHAFLIITTWDRAERLVKPLLERAGEETRADLIGRLFLHGTAIGWLSMVLRSETFAHGRHGNERKPERDWILSDEEYDRVAAIMVQRYRALSLLDIVTRTRPLNMLFAWRQAGDEDGPKTLIETSIADDEVFVQALLAFVTDVNSSDRGRYEVLAAENVRHFLDYSEATARIDEIAPETLTNAGQARLARLRAALANTRLRG